MGTLGSSWGGIVPQQAPHGLLSGLRSGSRLPSEKSGLRLPSEQPAGAMVGWQQPQFRQQQLRRQQELWCQQEWRRTRSCAARVLLRLLLAPQLLLLLPP